MEQLGWLTSGLAVIDARKGVCSLEFELLGEEHPLDAVHPGALRLVAGGVRLGARLVAAPEPLLGHRVQLILRLRAEAAVGRAHVQVGRVLQPPGAQAVVVVHVHQHARLQRPLGLHGRRRRALRAVVDVEAADR